MEIEELDTERSADIGERGPDVPVEQDPATTAEQVGGVAVTAAYESASSLALGGADVAETGSFSGAEEVQTDPLERTYLQPGEVAKILHVSPKTISRWARQGKFKHVLVTFGNHRRFSSTEVEEIAKQMGL